MRAKAVSPAAATAIRQYDLKASYDPGPCSSRDVSIDAGGSFFVDGVGDWLHEMVVCSQPADTPQEGTKQIAVKLWVKPSQEDSVVLALCGSWLAPNALGPA